MDGKSNDNNRNNAANTDDKQNDELSMFRRSNDFRTRKRKKFKDKVEDDITYQKYHHDIKNFNIESTLQNSVNVNRGQSNPTIFAKNHDEIDDIETLEDVKKFFEQRENKE